MYAALQRPGHGQADGVAGGGLLNVVPFFEDGGVVVNGGILQTAGNSGNQRGNFLLVENHLAAECLLGLDGLIARLNGSHHVGNLLVQGFFIQVAEVILLIQLNALFCAVVGGDSLHHGIISGLALVDAAAVGDGFVVPVDEHLNGIQRAVFNAVGIKHGVCHHSSQSIRAELGKVAFNGVFSCFVSGQGIGLVVDEQRFLHGFLNQPFHLLLGGGRVDEEICVA